MTENIEISDFSIDDLQENDNFNFKEKRIFDLKKNCTIFNKSIDYNEVEIQIHKDVVVSECIPMFNEYLKWLNSDNCKNDLIKKFCEFVNSYSDKKITEEEIIYNKWFEELEAQSALIYIPKNYKKMFFGIICVDNWHILYIEMEENKIISIDDQYVNPENGVGYNGIWK